MKSSLPARVSWLQAGQLAACGTVLRIMPLCSHNQSTSIAQASGIHGHIHRITGRSSFRCMAIAGINQSMQLARQEDNSPFIMGDTNIRNSPGRDEGPRIGLVVVDKAQF